MTDPERFTVGPEPTEDASSTEAGAVTADAAESAVERLRAEAAEAHDRALRAQAELENVRKRMRREMEEERKFAASLLLVDLLPVVDNIGRALSAAEKSPDVAALTEGVKMVARQLDGVLARHHCKRIEAAGRPFDPNLHAAVMQQPAADVAASTVLNVVQEGYQLHERVLRPSQVIVSKLPE